MALALHDARAWDPLLSLGEHPDGDQLVHRGYEPAIAAQMAPLPEDIDPRIASALIAQGIAELYTHQAEAYALARAGTHVCVVTGTASGKSEPKPIAEFSPNRPFAAIYRNSLHQLRPTA